jgi:hypothetical protein
VILEINVMYLIEFANALVNPISYVENRSKKEEMLSKLVDDNEVKQNEAYAFNTFNPIEIA